ncbi:MAG TPA: hypothetical protein VGM56_14960, partial [Byssovorax sp.]
MRDPRELPEATAAAPFPTLLAIACVALPMVVVVCMLADVPPQLMFGGLLVGGGVGALVQYARRKVFALRFGRALVAGDEALVRKLVAGKPGERVVEG